MPDPRSIFVEVIPIGSTYMMEYTSHKFAPNVGKNFSPMEHMGLLNSLFVSFLLLLFGRPGGPEKL